jgi:hypothetical protein
MNQLKTNQSVLSRKILSVPECLRKQIDEAIVSPLMDWQAASKRKEWRQIKVG